jgi:serine/threonine protein kinase
LDGIAIALKLCAAVQDLAALQVIHRDLKPDNVILLGDGDVRLLDLGLAYLPGIDEPDDDRLGGTTIDKAPELFRDAPADRSALRGRSTWIPKNGFTTRANWRRRSKTGSIAKTPCRDHTAPGTRASTICVYGVFLHCSLPRDFSCCSF